MKDCALHFVEQNKHAVDPNASISGAGTRAAAASLRALARIMGRDCSAPAATSGNNCRPAVGSGTPPGKDWQIATVQPKRAGSPFSIYPSPTITINKSRLTSCAPSRAAQLHPVQTNRTRATTTISASPPTYFSTVINMASATKIFSLEGKGLKLTTAEDLEPHIADLRASNNLEEVHLLGNTLGVGACKLLGEVLATKKTLRVQLSRRI
jgi:hypothetical protein